MGVGKLERSKCAIRKAAICGAVAAAMVSCNSAMGTTYTWSGLSGTQPPFIPFPNWSNANNWFAPGVPASANTTDVVFGPSAFPVPLQDLANPFIVSSLSFISGSGGYLLQGSPISLQGSATITDNASYPVEVQNNLAFPGGGVYTGTGSMTFSGGLSGTGLTSTATEILTLSGGGSLGQLNVSNGRVDVTAGTLNLTTANSSLYVGSSASPAILGISGGATVNVSNKIGTALGIFSRGALYITEPGSKLVANTFYGGTFNPSSPATAYLYVAQGGAINGGEFNLSGDTTDPAGLFLVGGGTASHSTAYVGWFTGTRGEVIIDGAGSRWTVSTLLALGSRDVNAGGTGLITVQNQGVLVASLTDFASPSSAITVDGGSFGTGTLASEDIGMGTL